MPSPIPSPIRPLLDTYLSRLDTSLPGFLTGFYLHGSIALDAFNERHSDIDFVAVTSRVPTPQDLIALRAAHRATHKDYPRWPLQGCYLQPADLGRAPAEIAPAPNYSDARLDRSATGITNDVTWWIIKNRGIALRGPDPSALDFTVDVDRMLSEMRENLHTYWAHWPDRPSNLAWLLLDTGVAWAVLGPLRQFYSFQERAIIDKSGAGRYALDHLPAEFHPIIREAIRCRDGVGAPHYKSRLTRAQDAIRLLRHVIATA